MQDLCHPGHSGLVTSTHWKFNDFFSPSKRTPPRPKREIAHPHVRQITTGGQSLRGQWGSSTSTLASRPACFRALSVARRSLIRRALANASSRTSSNDRFSGGTTSVTRNTW